MLVQSRPVPDGPPLKHPMPWLSPYFELSRGSAHNVRPMEGLRGFAVFLVFLVHYATLVGDWLIDGAAALPLLDTVSPHLSVADPAN